LVEQRIENPRVGGSIPPQATKVFQTLSPAIALGFLFFWQTFGDPAEQLIVPTRRSSVWI
jgi:hypothetical protein